MNSWRVVEGDALERLRELDSGSVQTCVTSPPYFGLRDYGDDGQLGLEKTPDEYVARLVGVFREVRRVLRDDGTLWLNLGDSYAGGGGYSPGSPSNVARQGALADGNDRDGAFVVRGEHNYTPKRSPGATPGVKPKDLIGIPWMVAEALKAPYYTGTIKDERDRIWLAAMIDAEGCMFIHKRKVGQSNGQGYVRKNDSYGSGLEISSTDRCIVDRIMEITGRGSICEQTPQQNDRRKQTIYRWNLRTNECRDVIREIYPNLVAKQHEARLVIGCPSSGSDAARAHESLKAIHQGGTPDIDFAAPESMFEGGWFLRSDIIWSKLPMPNPMPESVTDRPTKAHEYVFLLSKQPRYYYDSDSIREAPSDAFHTDRQPGTSSADAYHVASGRDDGGSQQGHAGFGVDAGGRNKRSVWTVATQPFPGAHFAVFPPKLIEPCVLAGSAEDACGVCGAPWQRVVECTAIRDLWDGGPRDGGKLAGRQEQGLTSKRTGLSASNSHNDSTPQSPEVRTLGFESSCDHQDKTGSSTVLDPFSGAGTTGLVATRLGRSYIGIELNPTYAEMSRERIRDDAPLMNYILEQEEVISHDLRQPRPEVDE